MLMLRVSSGHSYYQYFTEFKNDQLKTIFLIHSDSESQTSEQILWLRKEKKSLRN